MSLSDFERMRVEEISAAITERARMEERRERQGWERARMSAAASLAPHLQKGRSADPRKLFPFPWDAEGGAAKETQADVERLKRRMQKMNEQWREAKEQ